jgi:DNA-binding NtrC family response regulator
MTHILVCDDEPEIVEFISDILTGSGYEVTGLSEPSKVRSTVDNHRIDLVILDFRMGQMNGQKVLNVLREKYSPVELPVAFLTSYAEKSLVEDVARTGISAFLIKPPDMNTFVEKIKNILAQRLENSDIPQMLRLCNVSDHELAKEPGLSNIYSGNLKPMYRVRWKDKSYVVVNHGQNTPKFLATQSINIICSELIIYSLFGSKWHRIWPTAWDMDAPPKT